MKTPIDKDELVEWLKNEAELCRKFLEATTGSGWLDRDAIESSMRRRMAYLEAAAEIIEQNQE